MGKWPNLSIRLLRKILFIRHELPWGKFWQLCNLCRYLHIFLDIQELKIEEEEKITAKLGLRNLHMFLDIQEVKIENKNLILRKIGSQKSTRRTSFVLKICQRLMTL